MPDRMEGETHDRPGGLIVRDLLRIPHFRDAVLLGGETGLGAAVTRVNVMEVPDVADWVRPGEFLMTTGYPFRQQPEAFETLVAQLAAKGVSALGIKPKRFIDKVPEGAIRAANEHGLPLIELPPSTAFSDVVREVMERVLVQESRQLSTLQSRVQRLSRTLLQGDGLAAFLELVESMLGNPAVLLDGDDRCLASPGAAEAVAGIGPAGWAKLREDSAMETCFMPVGGRNVRVYCAAALDGPRQPVLLLLFELRREYDIVDMLTMNWAAELVGFEISNRAARQRIEAKYIGQFLQDWIAGRIVSPSDLRLRAEACGCPIADGDEYRVGLVRFAGGRPPAHALQEAARQLGFGRAPGREPGAAVRWTVLDGELVALFSRPRTAPAAVAAVPGSRSVAAAAGERTAASAADSRAATAAAGERTAASAADSRAAAAAVGERTVASAADSRAAAAAGADAVTAVAGARTAASAAASASRGAGSFGHAEDDAGVWEIVSSLRQTLKFGRFRFCLGRWVGSRGDVPESYREARRAAEVAELCRMRDDVVAYGRLGTYLLLYRLAGSPEAEEFTEETLRPLLSHDSRHYSPGALIETLKAYFECNGNVKETAERLFVHYNTVAYRLERIRGELGIPLDDAETRLRLQLAIKLHEIREK